MKRFLWGWVLLCTLSVTLAFSQTANTSLRGTVKDPSGALVPGATITLPTTLQASQFSTTVKQRRSLLVPAVFLRPSTPSLPPPHGFGSQKKTAELLVNQPATIDFALTVQSSTVTVDVSASAQTLNYHRCLDGQLR